MMRYVICVGLIPTLLLLACEDDVIRAPRGSGNRRAGSAQVVDAGAPEAAVVQTTYDDETFVEQDDRNRDPFRSFAKVFKTKAPSLPQRHVQMPTIAIDEMRLIAVITGVSSPRAMFVDPSGVGHVVKQRDFIGRAEVIQADSTEGLSVPLNWRVERIRSTEVVLVREDPTAPNRPPLTRIVPLHEEGEELRLPSP